MDSIVPVNARLHPVVVANRKKIPFTPRDGINDSICYITLSRHQYCSCGSDGCGNSLCGKCRKPPKNCHCYSFKKRIFKKRTAEKKKLDEQVVSKFVKINSGGSSGQLQKLANLAEAATQIAPEVAPRVAAQVGIQATPEVASRAAPKATPRGAPRVAAKIAPTATPQVAFPADQRTRQSAFYTSQLPPRLALPAAERSQQSAYQAALAAGLAATLAGVPRATLVAALEAALRTAP